MSFIAHLWPRGLIPHKYTAEFVIQLTFLEEEKGVMNKHIPPGHPPTHQTQATWPKFNSPRAYQQQAHGVYRAPGHVGFRHIRAILRGSCLHKQLLTYIRWVPANLRRYFSFWQTQSPQRKETWRGGGGGGGGAVGVTVSAALSARAGALHAKIVSRANATIHSSANRRARKTLDTCGACAQLARFCVASAKARGPNLKMSSFIFQFWIYFVGLWSFAACRTVKC